jgi:hypothetical protein
LKKILIAIVALLSAGLATGCSVAKADQAHQGIHAKGGAFSATKFANCISPSTRDYDGPGDKHYYYPAGQRTFSFTGRDGSEIAPIAVTDQNGQQIVIPGYVTFTLTSDCDLLRQFHERIGLKYHAYADKGDADQPQGWLNMLNDYMATPLQQALNKAAQDADGGWKALYTNTAVQQKFESDVKDALPDLVAQAMGGQYFTINQVSISKPEISQGLQDAIEARQEAEQAKAAQVAKNKTIKTQYQTVKDCLKSGLSEQSCTLIYLEQSGANIPFVPVPQGGSINYQGESQP